ncbi:hypothetical protein [Methylocystis echinoides]|uniref:hypothetical protein n=1 Tax=Methylocystis echinoides TaxID=29468 RepID=UPI003445111D
MADREVAPIGCKIIPIRPDICLAEAAATATADRLMHEYRLIEALRVRSEIEGDRARAKIAREMATNARKEWLTALREPVRLRLAKTSAL